MELNPTITASKQDELEVIKAIGRTGHVETEASCSRLFARVIYHVGSETSEQVSVSYVLSQEII